jgi:hypothetical protein
MSTEARLEAFQACDGGGQYCLPGLPQSPEFPPKLISVDCSIVVDCLVELPLTRLIGLNVPISDGSLYKVLRLGATHTAELRLNRIFCEKPIRLCAWRDGTVFLDVEKLVFEQGWEGEVRVWAEVEGVSRLGRIEGTARAAVVFERTFWGIPSTCLPIILMILLCLAMIPTLTFKYSSFLSPLGGKILYHAMSYDGSEMKDR